MVGSPPPHAATGAAAAGAGKAGGKVGVVAGVGGAGAPRPCPLFRVVACRRGRHRDGYLMADELVGSRLGDAYPAAAICEVCGRAVKWPNGTPTLGRGEWEWGWPVGRPP